MLTTTLGRSVVKHTTRLSTLTQNVTVRGSQAAKLSTSRGNSGFINIAEPVPALAYAYDCQYDDDAFDNADTFETNTGSFEVTTDATSMAGNIKFVKATGPSLTSPNTPNYNATNRKLSGGGGPPSGGGGGNGKHKCPKCGMSVTFKHGDFEENTFYCATCSGWFLVKNAEKSDASLNSAFSASTYDEFKEDKGSGSKQRKISRPQILMTHVSQLILFKCISFPSTGDSIMDTLPSIYPPPHSFYYY